MHASGTVGAHISYLNLGACATKESIALYLGQRNTIGWITNANDHRSGGFGKIRYATYAVPDAQQHMSRVSGKGPAVLGWDGIGYGRTECGGVTWGGISWVG